MKNFSIKREFRKTLKGLAGNESGKALKVLRSGFREAIPLKGIGAVCHLSLGKFSLKAKFAKILKIPTGVDF